MEPSGGAEFASPLREASASNAPAHTQTFNISSAAESVVPPSGRRTSLFSFMHTPEPCDLRGRLDYVDGFRRLQSTTFLFVGACSGIIGFAFAGFLGIYKYKHYAALAGMSYRGEPFESGRNFHPATVSEMVRDPASPEGKVFFAFCMLSAVCILVSAYPWSLCNVFIGHDHSRFVLPFCGAVGERPIWVSLVNFRQFLPPIGLVLVVSITVTSGPRTFCESFAAGLHTAGAGLMFVVYIAFEFHALWWSPVLKLKLKGLERWLRKWMAISSLVFSLGFLFCGVIMNMCEKSCRGGDCSCTRSDPYSKLCVDRWQVPSLEDVQYSKDRGLFGAWVREVTAHQVQQELLLNTAKGWFATLKQTNYWLEVLAGLVLLASHLVIWYFCPERNVVIGGALPDVQSQDRNMERLRSDEQATLHTSA